MSVLPTLPLGASSSPFEADAALLALAGTYLPLADASTLRSGLLGFMVESMGQAVGEAAYHRNVLYKENFLNTASLPRSIYNFAKLYDYQVGLASPSMARMLVGVFLDDVRAAIGATTGSFTLPRGQVAYLGSTPFVLAGEVVLTVLDGNRVTAQYTAANMDVGLGGADPYIRTYIAPQLAASGATRTAVFMEVRAYQLVKGSAQFQVVSASTLETSFFQVPTPAGAQLAGFSVFYQVPGSSAWVPLPAFFNDQTTPTDPAYCFFSYTGDGSLQVFFSTVPGLFRPVFNSLLRVDFLTSSGAAGNFTFTGSPSVTLGGAQRAMAVMAELVTQPTGGLNRESLLKTKQNVEAKLLFRNNLIIENDLVTYLNGVVTQNEVAGSLVQFVKRRDDIQKRQFSAFLMVQDPAGRVVPTNTVDLDLEISDLDANGWSLKPGTLVVYDRRQALYRLLGPGEYPDQMVADPNSFVYAVPFLMAFRSSPLPHLLYYRTHANLDLSVSTQAGDLVVADSFLANSTTVTRNAAIDDAYTIDLPITSNLTVDQLGRLCIVRAVFVTPALADIGYVECQVVPGTNVFRAVVTSTDTFDGTGQLILGDSLTRESDGALLPSAAIPEGLTLRFELYFASGDPVGADRFVERSGVLFHHVRVFQTAAPVGLYQSLETVMVGNLSVTAAGTFHVEATPLVGASYFLNPRLTAGALDTIGAYHTALEAAFLQLPNNTSTDVKLFNTYGPSLLYTLDRVNLSLVLLVKSRSTPSDDLRNAVLAKAVAYVASVNAMPTPRLSVSNLTTLIETTVTDVAWVQVVSVNGTPLQSAQLLASAPTLEQGYKLVPEYLNAATVRTGALDRDPYAPDVTVNFAP